MIKPSKQQLDIHKCNKCKLDQALENVIKHYPVISFGPLENKPILVVGLNPSTREYEDNYILSSDDPSIRHTSQMTYFDSGFYGFFNKVEQFFKGTAKNTVGWEKKPWEKVGFTDLAKCPTRRNDGQWSKLKPSQRKLIINYCQGYLISQIKEVLPRLIIAYGTDVCRWFNPEYIRSRDAFTTIRWLDAFPVVLVPQTQGGYSRPEISKIQNEIASNYEGEFDE